MVTSGIKCAQERELLTTMKTESMPASFFYDEKELGEMNLLPEKMLPYRLSFQREELGPGYIANPLDDLFWQAAGRLKLAFQGATIKLDRRSAKQRYPQLPPHFEFSAGSGVSNYTYVRYTRQLSPIVVFYNFLDTGARSLDEVIESIKNGTPVAGIVEVAVDSTLISLKEGFDYPKLTAPFHGQDFSEDAGQSDYPAYPLRELTIHLSKHDVPWLEESKVEPVIRKDLKDIGLTSAVALTLMIVENYLAHRAQESSQR